MIIHSIVPIDIIFQNNCMENRKEAIYLRYMGELVEAISDGNEGYLVNRIISTSPAAFLNPELQPGVKIPLSAIKA